MSGRWTDLLARADSHFTRVAAESPGRLECRKGCTLCCFGLFEITRLDLALLEQGLASVPPAERERIEREATEILEKHPHPEDWDEMSEEERDAFFERTSGVKCPLLDARGGCAAYAHRPLLCRTFGLPIREGNRYIGDECGLNFVGAPRREKERAAWDLANEDDFDATDELTIPQAIAWIRRTRPAARKPKAGTKKTATGGVRPPAAPSRSRSTPRGTGRKPPGRGGPPSS